MKKAELRQTYKEKRARLSEEDFVRLNESLRETIFQSIDFRHFRCIHIFLPISHQKEFDTFPVISRLRTEFPNIQICVPRVTTSPNGLETVLLLEDSSLQVNRFGVPEPIGGYTVDSSMIDLVFVPLLCADESGYRVGYGKGLYDRFLANCRDECWKVGLSFFPTIGRIDDVDPNYDVPMNIVLVP